MQARLPRALVAAVLLLSAAPASAAVPSTLGYQGLLTDGGGSPVPNGTYDLTFTLYKVPSGGTVVWTESQPGVAVANGSFAVALGSVTPLTDVPFDRPYWLGITVGAGPEMTPRIELASSPYALGWRAPFAAITNGDPATLRLANLSGWPSLQVDGWSQVKEALGFAGLLDVNAPDGVRALQMWGGDGPAGGGSATYVTLGPGPVVTSQIGQEGNSDGSMGDLWIRGGGGDRYAVLSGWNLGTGDPHFRMNGTGSQFVIDTNKTGDAAAALPANSVGPAERFADAGLTHVRGANATVVDFPSYMVATTIVTPADGYIHVTASSGVWFSGTTGNNTVVYQIDTSPTAVENPAHSRTVGAHQWVSTVYHFETASAERVYYLPAGEHTFYLVATKFGTGAATFSKPTITAMFVPTGYGPVFTSVTAGEESAFGEVRTLPSGPTLDGRPEPPLRVVDLRELELRAVRARLELERAERGIEVAREQQERAAAHERIVQAAAARTTSAGSER